MPGINQILPILVDKIDIQADPSSREPFINGIETEIEPLDKAILGFHRGDLIVLASEPGVGKTTLALQLATHILINKDSPVPTNPLSERKRSVAFVTWRDSQLDIAMRAIAYGMEKSVRDVSLVQFADKDWEALTYSLGVFVQTDFQIENIPPEIGALENVFDNLKCPGTPPMGLVVIEDCWGYCEDAISAFRLLRWLKSWAMKNQVPVLLTAGVRQLEGNDPIWSHLNEFSDLALMLERGDGVSLRIIKQGMGAHERIKLNFDPLHLYS